MLHYHTSHEVLDFLDSDTLREVSKLNKMYNTKYRDLIYYRHALERKLLYSLSYFLKDEFPLPFFGGHLQILFDYINENSDLLIAGGFPTQLYMGYRPKDSSDIDIYVLATEQIKNGDQLTVTLVHQVKRLIEFIESAFTVIGVIRVGPSVYTILVREFEHPIQIIVTTNGTPAEILSSFDNSHNRCGIYMGHTYIGKDTKVSHEKRVTYFYTTPRASRYQKAIELGFTIFGISESELERIMSEPKPENTQLLQKLQMGTIAMDLLGLKAHKNWKISYADQELVTSCYDIERVDLEKGLTERVQKSLSNATTKKHIGHRKILRLTEVLKDPSMYYLKIRKPFIVEYLFEVKGVYKNNNGAKMISVTDPSEMEKLKRVKSNALEIFKAYHGGFPEKIKNSRCLTKWQDFLNYRNNIGAPIKDQNELIKEGYEYYDGIIIYNDEIQIKNIELSLLTTSLRNEERTFHMYMTPVIRYNEENNVCTWGSCEYRIKSID